MVNDSNFKITRGDVDVTATDGDLYLNDGASYHTEPEERKAEEREAASTLSSSYPILADLANWFRDEIKSCSNVDGIVIGELEVDGVKYNRTVSIEAQILAQKMLKQRLIDISDRFDSFAEEHEA